MSRAFRAYLVGSGISSLGDWLSMLAINWLIVSELGRRSAPVLLEESDRSPSEAVDGPTIALAESLVRSRAQEAGLAYELIAARADLSPVVVAARRGNPEPNVRTLQGWRRELVGAELLELLGGRRTLSVGKGGRVQINEAEDPPERS